MNLDERKGTRRVLEEIVKYIDEHEYAPSVRELCTLTEFRSLSSIAHHMEVLFGAGYLETDIPRGTGAPRAFRIGERAYAEGYAERRVKKSEVL